MFQQNQDIFNILSEALSEGVIIVDDTQKIVGVNSSTNEMFGYEIEDLIGESLHILIPQKYHKGHKGHVKGFMKNGIKRKMGGERELYGAKKCGNTFPVEVGLNPFEVYGKKYVMALVIDITERKENEKNLIMKSQALESAKNGVVICDALKPKHPIIYCNNAFKELTGYSEDEIIHQNCRFLQSDDKDQEAIEEIRRALKEHRGCKVVLRNYKKDGTLFWNELSITPILDKFKNTTHFVGIQNDITESKKVEQELLHWAKIFDESLNEIFIFDANTLQFIDANRGALRNIGFSLNEIVELTPVNIKPDYNEKQFRQVLTPLLSKKEEKIKFETVHQRKDGTTYPVEVHLQLSSLGDQEVFVAIILDITESKNYTSELEQKVEQRTEQLKLALAKEKELNELKTKFLSLVSHEFKTPLSGILTSTILLEKYKLSEQQEKRDKHLKTITSKVHYLNNILNDFLSIERLDTGKENYNFKDFNLSKVVNEVVYNANMLLKDGQHIIYT